jgi:hypothetical protein
MARRPRRPPRSRSVRRSRTPPARDELSRTRIFVAFYLRRVRTQVQALRGRTYPGHHSGPARWLSLVGGLLDTAEIYLSNSMETSRDEAEVRTLITDASQLCSNAYYCLEIMSGADVSELPYPLVRPLQRWFDELTLSQDTFFRTELVENYELRKFDRTMFSGIRDPAPSLTDVINNTKWPILRVTVPGRAMGIIPHFAIVAHEIGHAMMPRINLSPVDTVVRAETADIMGRLGTLGVASPTRATSLFLQEVLLSWIEEFAADAFAGFLTGPAAFFSLSEFLQLAHHHGICDTHPSNELRRGALFREMEAGSPSFCDIFKKHTSVDLIAEINSALIVAAPTETEIMQDMIDDGHSREESAAIAALHGSMARIAQATYGSVRTYLRGNTSRLIYTVSMYDTDLRNHLPALLAAIPPIENGLDIHRRTPCDFAAIINVGWVVLLTKLNDLRVRAKPDDQLGSEKVERLHDLLLKAVELAEVRREWENA